MTVPEQAPNAPPTHAEVATAMAFVERWILSAVYLYLAWLIADGALVHTLGWTSSGHAAAPTFPEAATDVLLFTMQFFIGLMLLFSKRPAPQSPTLREIFVPLAAAFFFLVYNTIPWFPPALQQNLYPTTWPSNVWSLHPLDMAGLLCGLIGPAISVWGVISLRLSFGIFVSVREIVLKGPYKYVRHPIYLGYFFSYGGLVLLERSIAITLLAAIHLSLFVWRARLEEARLAAHSAEYREHMKHSGFLFPRISGK